jgi:hypothetical protein
MASWLLLCFCGMNRKNRDFIFYNQGDGKLSRMRRS